MKKVIIKTCVIILLCLFGLWLLAATGEEITYHENGVPTYFLEPEGHVIVYVNVLDDSFLVDRYLYGYITNEDYQAYLNGELQGVLVIKHPYEVGKSVTTNVNMIEGMQVGVYKDLRHKY